LPVEALNRNEKKCNAREEDKKQEEKLTNDSLIGLVQRVARNLVGGVLEKKSETKAAQTNSNLSIHSTTFFLVFFDGRTQTFVHQVFEEDSHSFE
jgi:hypothetical protein